MTTHPDYRAALAEIADLLNEATDPDDLGIRAEQAIARARELLAAPEAVGVTDEEILELAAKALGYVHIRTDARELEADAGELIAFARAVLTRYAHPAPVPVGERPWERDGWLDHEGRCWWWDAVASRWIWRTDEVGASLVEVTLSLPHWALPLPGDP